MMAASKSGGRMTTVAIIGSAGREKQLTPRIYEGMVAKSLEICRQHEKVELVSGGAAWADHVAVTLHKVHGYPLTLHLPCAWDLATKAYVDMGGTNWMKNPGGTANFYHRKFASSMGHEEDYTLQSLDELIRTGQIKTTVSRGFHARNRKVAGTDVMIAFTYGTNYPLQGGGTAHTWGLARGTRSHICLTDLE
jgi:hypothetical protein